MEFIKDGVHDNYVRLMTELAKGVNVRDKNRSVLNYLMQVINESLPSIRMEEVKILNDLDIEDVAYKLGDTLNFALNNSIPLTTAACTIGKAVLMGHETVKMSVRDREIRRFKVGFHLLDVVAKDKKVKFSRDVVDKKGKTDKQIEVAKTRAPYRIKVVDHVFALNLSIAFYRPDPDKPIFTKPFLTEPSDWTGYYHPQMGELVRNCVEEAIPLYSKDKMPRVYDFMNKVKKVSYTVHTDALNVFNQCFNIDPITGEITGDDLFTFNDKLLTDVQKKSILDQQTEIFKIADSLGVNKFWLASFLCPRGRFYYANTYFHPQGNKLSRALITFSEKKRIGKRGWFNLLIAAASEYGMDKKTRVERFKFAKENLEKWVAWATDPLNNKGIMLNGERIEDGWQTADNPYAFYVIISEIRNALAEDDKLDYQCNVPYYIDASNSGTQILAALSLDEISGRLSNLTADDKRGDAYLHIADIVFDRYDVTEEEEKIFEKINKEILDFQKRIEHLRAIGEWDKAKEVVAEQSEHYTENKTSIFIAGKVFWNKMYEKRRKLSKRPVMTIPYSAGVRTIANAIFNDWKSESEMAGLCRTYAFLLALHITETYHKEFDKPTRLMNLFMSIGYQFYKKGKDLSFVMPLSGFQFVNNVRKDRTERVTIKRRGRKVNYVVCTGYSAELDADKSRSAPSPNIIHGADAALMMELNLIIKHPMINIHDSWGIHMCDGDELFEETRNTFVHMFDDHDVLNSILAQTGFSHLEKNIEKGNLIIEEVKFNEFAFA